MTIIDVSVDYLTHSHEKLRGRDIELAAERLASLPCRTAPAGTYFVTLMPEQRPLIDLQARLAELYRASTTASVKGGVAADVSFIVPSRPLCIVRAEREEDFTAPRSAVPLSRDQLNKIGCVVYSFDFKHRESLIPSFFIGISLKKATPVARFIFDRLRQLHALEQALRVILRGVANKSLSPVRGTAASDFLQKALHFGSRRVLRWRRELDEYLLLSPSRVLEHSDRGSVDTALRDLDARPTLRSKILNLANVHIAVTAESVAGNELAKETATPAAVNAIDTISAEVERVLKEGRNSGRFAALASQSKSDMGVVPFVGAGLSVSAGFPAWREFLLEEAKQSGIEEEVQKHLAAGRFEEAAQLLKDKHPYEFDAFIAERFGTVISGVARPVALLPLLARGPVITTNLDRLLEYSFKLKNAFDAVVWGARLQSVDDALYRNKRYLIKMHGDAADKTDRVLTLDDYKNHYGSIDADAVDFHKPLPKALSAIFSKRSLLFLGCSLTSDRTMALLHRVRKEADSMPYHYAIVEAPADPSTRQERAIFLEQRGVRPIWYPQGRHYLIEPLLLKLVT